MVQVQVRSRHSSREDELREAHQRAFDKIQSATARPDYREAVSRAVAELIDACEAYVNGNHRIA
jgi:hypothetical protein